MLQFDSDGSGSIDFPEFLSLIAKIQKDALDDREEIKEAITVFDKDQKGFLTKNQVENIMNNIGELHKVFQYKQLEKQYGRHAMPRKNTNFTNGGRQKQFYN